MPSRFHLGILRTWSRPFLTGNRPCLILLVLVNLLFFGDVLFTENTFFYRDIGGYHYPLKRLVTESYAKGEWPLWNPYVQFGQPLLANPNAMAFYPTQLFFQLMPFHWAFELNLVIHCLIGGLGAFYLARSLGLSPIASLAAGIAFNFGGVVISLVNLPLLVAMASLMPWLALLLKKTIQSPSPPVTACLSFVFALLLMLLEPLTTAAVFLFLVPFGAYLFFTRSAVNSRRKIILALLVVLVTGVLLAAVQLIPAAELIANSGRHGGLIYKTATFWSLNPFNLTQMLFPQVWEDTFDLAGFDSLRMSAFSETREAYIVSCYGGLACLLIALLGLFFSEKVGLKRVMAVVALAAVILAMGKYTPVYYFLYHYIRPFRYGRYPTKYLLTFAMCLSLLAGLGIDQLSKLHCHLTEARKKKVLVIFFGTAICLLLFSGLLAGNWFWKTAGLELTNDQIKLNYQGTPIYIGHSLVQKSVLYLFLVVVATLILVAFASFKKGTTAAWIPCLLTGLLFFDLFTNHAINPVISAVAYERPPLTEWLRSKTRKTDPFRIHHLFEDSTFQILGQSNSLIWHFLFGRLTGVPYSAAADHVQYSSFMPVDRLETLYSQVIDAELRATKGVEGKVDYLGRLNTRYVLAVDDLRTPLLEHEASFKLNSDQLLRVYRVKNALPRAFLKDWPTKNSRLEGTPDGVELTRYEPAEVGLNVTAPRKCTLVLLDSYYPGWRVWVDGQEGRVEPVNEAFRGVVLTPGKHRVLFRYDPKSFRYGLALTLVTAAAWMVALVFIQIRKYRRRKAAVEVSAEPELVGQ